MYVSKRRHPVSSDFKKPPKLEREKGDFYDDSSRDIPVLERIARPQDDDNDDGETTEEYDSDDDTKPKKKPAKKIVTTSVAKTPRSVDWVASSSWMKEQIDRLKTDAPSKQTINEYMKIPTKRDPVDSRPFKAGRNFQDAYLEHVQTMPGVDMPLNKRVKLRHGRLSTDDATVVKHENAAASSLTLPKRESSLEPPPKLERMSPVTQLIPNARPPPTTVSQTGSVAPVLRPADNTGETLFIMMQTADGSSKNELTQHCDNRNALGLRNMAGASHAGVSPHNALFPQALTNPQNLAHFSPSHSQRSPIPSSGLSSLVSALAGSPPQLMPQYPQLASAPYLDPRFSALFHQQQSKNLSGVVGGPHQAPTNMQAQPLPTDSLRSHPTLSPGSMLQATSAALSPIASNKQTDGVGDFQQSNAQDVAIENAFAWMKSYGKFNATVVAEQKYLNF